MHPDDIRLQLKRDLCFLDVESTGLNVIRDRILQIAIVKYFASGKEPAELNLMINPGVPISEEAMAVHGITPELVASKPLFNQVADQILRFIGDADLCGYNINRFDLPILMEEFYRTGIEFDVNSRHCVDVQRIFYKMEPRNLKAALRFYCNKEIENAHDALADVYATIDVLKGQLARYEGMDLVDDEGGVTPAPVRNDIKALHAFTNDYNTLDATQRLKVDAKGVIVFNFGKYIGQPVLDTLLKDKQYYHWIMTKEFSFQVKQIVKKLVSDHEKARRNG